MQINSVSAQNFKAYSEPVEIDFEEKANNYNRAIELTKDFEDKFVNSEDIKSPGAVALSVGAAGSKTFLKTTATVFAVDQLSNKKVSSFIEGGLRKGAGLIENLSDKMVKNQGKKMSKIVGGLGNVIQKTEGGLKAGYKKLALVTKDGIKTHSASKGIAILAGIASVLAFVPAICKKDNNGDGVADLVQKSQSAYDKTSNKCSKIVEGANCLTEIAQLIS